MDNIISTSTKPNFGNRCGHMRDVPRFYVRPTEYKKTYDVIHQSIDRVQEYYFSPVDNWLPNLGYARDSKRQQRSERREAITAITTTMLSAMDMATFKIIRHYDGKPIPLSIRELAKKANIGERRAERAIYDLKRAGYLELDYRYETLPTGEIKPLIAIKRLSALFFYHCGITYEKLQQVQAFARKRMEKFNKKLQMAVNVGKQTAKTMWTNLTKKAEYKPLRTYEPRKITNDLIAKWQSLREHHPNWSAEQIKAAAI